ncbi:MAG TPA: glycosyl hydrolase family 17 protein [Polyangia bacterium]|nr:glycosyl hydrolase family 17 protein [Polyangia bacterium]
MRAPSPRASLRSSLFLTAFLGACAASSGTPGGGGGTTGATGGSTGGTTGSSTGGSTAAGGDTGSTGGSSGGTTGSGGSSAGGSTAAGGSGGSGGVTATGGGGGSGGASSGGAGGTIVGGVGGVFGGASPWSSKPLSVIAYSPYRDGQAPGGAQPSMAQVKSDLQMLAPLVDGIRVYGTDGANGYIPALCDQLGIDLHLGAWIDGIATDEPNVHALAAIVNEGHPRLKTAIIGNEVLARAANGTNNVTEERMIQLINIAKADIKVKVTIAEADTYPQWMKGRPNLAAAVDLIIWHTYAYWSGQDISGAYALVSQRWNDMLGAYPGKPMILGETGWPTMVDHASTDMTMTSVANEVNQARFYKEALAGFRARNLSAWMFSAIDEKWKATSGEGLVGGSWGIFTSARQPKMAATMLMTK